VRPKAVCHGPIPNRWFKASCSSSKLALCPLVCTHQLLVRWGSAISGILASKPGIAKAGIDTYGTELARWSAECEVGTPLSWLIGLFGPKPIPLRTSMYAFHHLNEFSKISGADLAGKDPPRLGSSAGEACGARPHQVLCLSAIPFDATQTAGLELNVTADQQPRSAHAC
jgi:hypothetical protein